MHETDIPNINIHILHIMDIIFVLFINLDDHIPSTLTAEFCSWNKNNKQHFLSSHSSF